LWFGWAGIADNDDVAPALSINFKANLPKSLDAFRAAVCSRRDLDQLNVVIREWLTSFP